MPRGDDLDLLGEAAVLCFCRKQCIPAPDWDTMSSKARGMWRDVALAVVVELGRQEQDDDGNDEEEDERDEEGEGAQSAGCAATG